VTQKPDTFNGIKNLMKSLYESTDNNDLKMGLEIIVTLISHHKKEVVARSLGNLYILIQDESIRKLIVTELKEMKCDNNVSVRKSAEESLEIITGEVNKYMVFEFSFDILNNIFYNLDDYIHTKISFIKHNHNYINKFNSKLKKRMLHSRLVENWNGMMYNFLKVMLVIDHNLKLFDIDMVDMDEYYVKNLDQPFIVPYSELSNIEVTNEFYFENLINIYAMTFREKGHLHHLKSLLDDDNYKIRRMAIDALIYALKILTGYKVDNPYQSLILEVLENINSTLFKSQVKEIYASK
jgi:hypothetical protein